MTTEEETPMLVFKNEVGDYFLVPQEALEEGRVPAEHKAEVERLLAEDTHGGNGEDVQGFSYARMYVLLGSNIGFRTSVTTDTGRLSPGLQK